MHILITTSIPLIGLLLIWAIIRLIDDESLKLFLAAVVGVSSLASIIFLTLEDGDEFPVSMIAEPVYAKKIGNQSIKVFDFHGHPFPYTDDEDILEAFYRGMEYPYKPQMHVYYHEKDVDSAYIYKVRVNNLLGITKRYDYKVWGGRNAGYDITLSINEMKNEVKLEEQKTQ